MSSPSSYHHNRNGENWRELQTGVNPLCSYSFFPDKQPNTVVCIIKLTPSQCQIEVDPLPVICSKHFNQKYVNENSFTQCPGEGGQEEVVQ